jgi:hypothetical protein
MLSALNTAIKNLYKILNKLDDPMAVFDNYYQSNNYIFTRLHTITGPSHISRMEGFCTRHPIESEPDKAVSLLVPNIVAENYDINMSQLPKINNSV